MTDLDPAIEIELGGGRVQVRQNRPQVTQSLRGMPVSEALRIVPSLLPVCGVAQAIAASRASSAARRQEPSPDQRANQASALWREQALAAVWRLTIDWPDLLGQSRDLKTLKSARQSASDAELGRLLEQLLPGLGEINTVEQLMDWSTRESGSAAALVRRAREAGATLADDPRSLCSGVELQGRAYRALSRDQYDSGSPEAEPTTAGPLAMGRSMLVRQLRAQLGNSTLTRLLAMVLDSQSIAETVAGDEPATEPAAGQRQITPGSGLGWAITARGPVFHQIALDDHQGVADWRVLAPTDWHFTPRGPLVQAMTRALDDGESEESLQLMVASFDPCAPWTLAGRPVQVSPNA